MPETVSNIQTTTAVLAMALQALSTKAVVIIALVMACGLFCWGMWRGDWAGLGVSSAFAILVFLPVLWRHTHARQDG